MIVKYGGNVSRPCKTRSLFPQSGNVTGISNSMFPSSLQSTDSRNVKWPVSENQCACDISFHTLPLVCSTAVLLWGVALCGNTIKNGCEVGYSASELSMNCIDSKLACCLLNILRASPHKCGWPGWPGVRDLAFFSTSFVNLSMCSLMRGQAGSVSEILVFQRWLSVSGLENCAIMNTSARLSGCNSAPWYRWHRLAFLAVFSMSIHLTDSDTAITVDKTMIGAKVTFNLYHDYSNSLTLSNRRTMLQFMNLVDC